MELLDAISSRHSVRAFRPESPAPGDLDRILKATNQAPSAGDLQAYEVVLVSDPECRRELAAAANNQAFLGEAPLILAFFAHPARSRTAYGSRGEQLFAIQDATIAAAYAQLAAHALGYGTAWVGEFDDSAVARALDAPAGYTPVCLLAVGRPGETPQPTSRRSLSDIVHHERLSN